MARGIERRQIFTDDDDRNFFLKRLGQIVLETENPLYAFALIPNHFHLLIRRGSTPIATMMQRVLTAYALYFNRRHGRAGHLFQNRYKSLICGDEIYLMALIRYINLNPVRAGSCSKEQLDYYPFAAHSYLMNNRKCQWLAAEAILGLFGDDGSEAKKAYAAFVLSEAGGEIDDDLATSACFKANKRELPVNLKRPGKEGRQDKCFVVETREKAQDVSILPSLISEVCFAFSVTEMELLSKSKVRKVCKARSQLAKMMAKDLGLTRSEIARRLAVYPSAVSKMLAEN